MRQDQINKMVTPAPQPQVMDGHEELLSIRIQKAVPSSGSGPVGLTVDNTIR